MESNGGIKLSILIPTLNERKEKLAELMAVLMPQIKGKGIEIALSMDDRQATTGMKRQKLLEGALGEYVCFIDDDDEVPDFYVEEILKAIEGKPDAIGFLGRITSTKSGQSKGIRFSIDNGDWKQDFARNLFLRSIGHLNPVRRELALKAGFEDKSWSEDRSYAEALAPHLATEVFIDKEMYHYITRTGI